MGRRFANCAYSWEALTLESLARALGLVSITSRLVFVNTHKTMGACG